MLYENKIKTYVSVEVLFDEAGQMMPRSVQWEDGRIFDIDRILDVRPAASLKAGGHYLLIILQISFKTKYL